MQASPWTVPSLHLESSDNRVACGLGLSLQEGDAPGAWGSVCSASGTTGLRGLCPSLGVLLEQRLRGLKGPKQRGVSDKFHYQWRFPARPWWASLRVELELPVVLWSLKHQVLWLGNVQLLEWHACSLTKLSSRESCTRGQTPDGGFSRVYSKYILHKV